MKRSPFTLAVEAFKDVEDAKKTLEQRELRLQKILTDHGISRDEVTEYVKEGK